MTSRDDPDFILASLSSSQRSPEEYEAMLKELPDSVKRSFVEMTSGAVREYCVRHVKKKLADNPGMAKLLDPLAVRKITEQIFNNIIEDQSKVKKTIAGNDDRSSGFGRSRRIHR